MVGKTSKKVGEVRKEDRRQARYLDIHEHDQLDEAQTRRRGEARQPIAR